MKDSFPEPSAWCHVSAKSTDNIISHQFTEDVVILNLSNMTFYGFKGIGAPAWIALECAATIQQAFLGLLNIYAVSEQDLACDLAAFIAELHQLELMSCRPAKAPLESFKFPQSDKAYVAPEPFAYGGPVELTQTPLRYEMHHNLSQIPLLSLKESLT